MHASRKDASLCYLGEPHSCKTETECLGVFICGDLKGQRGLGGLGKGSLTPRCRGRAGPGIRGLPPSWLPARTLQTRRPLTLLTD